MNCYITLFSNNIKLVLKSLYTEKRLSFFIISIIVVASIVRVEIYGSPSLSIATNDTDSYIEASRVALFSSEIMTGRRLLTTNLIYKAFEPKDGYQILVNGSFDTTRRLFQPGFDRIVILQLILSIIGWGLLAFTVSEHIKTSSMKVLSAITIIIFAFTPQIADWDSILMSESLTFSLFALQLAILIKIVFHIYDGQDLKINTYVAIWAITFFVWIFLRDTNLFTTLITIGMTAVLLLSAKFRKNKYIPATIVFVTALFTLGLITSSKSTRSLVQMNNIYNSDLLGSPASVATLSELGMPAPDSQEYEEWFKENASKTLIKFMLIHPGYPTLKIIKDFPYAFTENKQTYFKAPEQYQAREIAMTIGNALHPENTTPFVLDLFLLFGITALVVKKTGKSNLPWAWLGFWLFLTASLTFIPAILGDTWGLSRHALFSTMVYRLFMWLYLIILMDIAITQNSREPIQKTVQIQP